MSHQTPGKLYVVGVSKVPLSDRGVGTETCPPLSVPHTRTGPGGLNDRRPLPPPLTLSFFLFTNRGFVPGRQVQSPGWSGGERWAMGVVLIDSTERDSAYPETVPGSDRPSPIEVGSPGQPPFARRTRPPTSTCLSSAPDSWSFISSSTSFSTLSTPGSGRGPQGPLRGPTRGRVGTDREVPGSTFTSRSTTVSSRSESRSGNRGRNGRRSGTPSGTRSHKRGPCVHDPTAPPESGGGPCLVSKFKLKKIKFYETLIYLMTSLQRVKSMFL